MYTQEKIRQVQCRLLVMAKSIKNILDFHDIPYFITYGTLLGAVRHEGFIPWDDDLDLYLFADSYDRAMYVLEEELPTDYFLESEKTEPLYFHAWAHVKDLNTIAECELFPQDGSYSHKGISIDLYKMHKMKEKDIKRFHLEEHIAYLQRRCDKGLLDGIKFQQKMKELQDALLVLEKEDTSCIRVSDTEVYVGLFADWDVLSQQELFPLKEYKFEDTNFKGPNNAHGFLERWYGNYMQFPPMKERRPHYSDVCFLK